MSSPVNGPMRACTEEWHRKCSRLEHYEYVLLNESKTSTVMPVPLVTAMTDRARFFSSLDEPDGGTQADSASVPYSPWNHYAYPRLLWNAERTADELLEEFFAGYFREAKGPMLAYYRTLEDHMIRSDVSLRPPRRFGAAPSTMTSGPGRSRTACWSRCVGTWNRRSRRPRVGSWPRPRGRIREGFEWVLKESCFTAADLDSDSGFLPVPVDGTSARVDLTKIRYQKLYVEPRKEGGWFFGAHGMIAADVLLDTPGEYSSP